MATLTENPPLHDPKHMENCIICQEQLLDDDEEIAATPCEHMFHNFCIQKWNEKANTCPVCRETYNWINLRTGPAGMLRLLCAILFAHDAEKLMHCVQVIQQVVIKWIISTTRRTSIGPMDLMHMLITSMTTDT